MGQCSYFTKQQDSSKLPQEEGLQRKNVAKYNDMVINQAFYAQKLTNDIQHIEIKKNKCERSLIVYIEDNRAYHVLMQQIVDSMHKNIELKVIATIKAGVDYIQNHVDEIDLVLLDAILDENQYCTEILDQLISHHFPMNHVIILSRLYGNHQSSSDIMHKYHVSSFCPKPLNILHFKKILQSIFI